MLKTYFIKNGWNRSSLYFKSLRVKIKSPEKKQSDPINQSLGLLNSIRIKGRDKINDPINRNKYPEIETTILTQSEFIFLVGEFS